MRHTRTLPRQVPSRDVRCLWFKFVRFPWVYVQRYPAGSVVVVGRESEARSGVSGEDDGGGGVDVSEDAGGGALAVPEVRGIDPDARVGWVPAE